MKQIKTTLYALNKNGSYQEWKVFTEDKEVHVNFGQLGGKIQTKITTCEPKNVGRANETTAEQQAELEAISKWEKQVRLGYRETTEELDTEEVLTPMLAHDAIKRSHDLEYPLYVQPKLDGLRCLVTFDQYGEPVFNSRGNKTYPVEGKIVEQLKALRFTTGHTMFDGEVYLHGLSLQKIVSLAKKWRTHADIEKEIQKDYEKDLKSHAKALKENKPTYKNFKKIEVSVEEVPEKDINRYGGYESADLEFHIFDIPSKNKIWYNVRDKTGRLADLLNLIHGVCDLDFSHLKAVVGEICTSEEETKAKIPEYMVLGYEGIIARNFKGIYEFGQRSVDMQKWKIFQTAEAKVFDSIEDKNGEGVLQCIEQDGTVFGCKMKGTFAERKQSSSLRLIHKFITFSFQARTEDGVPQFPVGQYVRDVDPITWKVRE